MIQRETVEKVAELAKIKLNEEEIKNFQVELGEVLEAFSKLNEISGDETTFELLSQLRNDKETTSLSQKEALKNSEKTKDGYIVGPTTK